MDYSVIIITRNRAKVIAQTIDSVLKQTIKPTEFIIIDNNSTDGTIELLLKYKKKYPNFRIYRTRVDPGACRELNLGINLAKSPYILIIDDDALLINDDWVEIAYKNFRNNIAVVWGNISSCPDVKEYGEFFIGCAFLTRKDIFQQVGMFDEKFFIYQNELDITIRLNKYGYRILGLRKLNVQHPIEENRSRPIKDPKSLQRDYEFALSNRLLIFWKYYPYWVSFIASIFHSLRILQTMKDYSYIKYWLKGIKRFFSKLYAVGLTYKDRMGLKELFQTSYQLKFPAFSYKLVKFLYRRK